jgi:dTDP-glucose 4,6-dehydratase
MRVVLTGGAGFIASHWIDRLLADGHEVVALDDLSTGDLTNLAHHEGNPRLSIRRQDVSDPFDVEGRVDRVLHLASPASPIDYLRLPVQTLRVGSEGTRHALELARRKGATFLLASTSEVYGDPQEHPQRETYWGHVNPIGPRSVYDEAKRFAEALTMAYRSAHDVDTRIVRIFNTYGPRNRLDDGRVVPTLIAQALRGAPLTVFGDGSQTRSFQYVEDLIAGFEAVLAQPSGDPFNLGNPSETTVLEFAERVRDFTGSRSPIVFRPLPQDDPKQRRPDISRARDLLGWEPRVALADGLSRTISWYRDRIGQEAAHPDRV